MLVEPLIRDLTPPITEEQLGPLDSECQVVQFSQPLSDDEFVRVAEFLRPYPDMKLRAYAFYGRGFDLEFLRHFPFLRRFQVDVYGLHSLDGLRHLPDDLELLSLGQAKTQRFSLSILERFQSLKQLSLERHKKHIDVISRLPNLQELNLRSITLPDLSLLRPITELRSLSLKLGGTNDLALLPEIARLRYLEIWMVKGLADLSMLAQMHELQYLFLQTIKNVLELPSFGQLTNLRRIILESMKGITDLSGVAQAPCVEEMLLIDMPQLQPEAVRPFVGHPTLTTTTMGMCSTRKNRAAEEILGLPPMTTNLSPFQFR